MKQKFLLIAILFLAFVLRFYRLNLVPPGLYSDEVSIAYNAYSIDKTGKDEFGRRFPILFEAYGEYKLPVYIYLTAISEKIFGPTDFSVRLPSALAGVFAVGLIYLLLKKMTEVEPNKNISDKLPLLSATLLAITPWHLWFSRAGFEGNVALTLMLAALYFFLAGLKKHRYLVACLLLIALATETYLSVRIIGPLLIIVFFYFYRRKLLLRRGEIGLLLSTAALLTVFLGWSYFSPAATSHLNAQSAFNSGKNIYETFTGNFVKNFSFDFLFYRGEQDPLHNLKSYGELFLWQLPFILTGIYFLIRKSKKIIGIFLAWLLCGSLPVILSNQSPNALRGEMMVIPWITFASVGVVVLGKYFPAILLTCLILVVSLTFYLHSYFIHIPSSLGQFWGDSMEETVKYLGGVRNRHQYIYLPEDFQYTYNLWYLLYDPTTLQISNHNVGSLYNYRYVPGLKRVIPDQNLAQNNLNQIMKNSLLVVPGMAKLNQPFPGRQIHTVLFTNGEPAYIIYEL